jgi:hypothetical protein
MSALALLLLVVAQEPPAQPSSQPAAALQPGGTGADIIGNVTWIFEVDEKVLQIQESWAFTNESGRSVAKEHLVWEMPLSTRRLQLDEQSPGFQAAEDGSRLFATEDFGAGNKRMTAQHLQEFKGGTAVVRRTFPVRVANARLILENVSGLDFTSNVEFDKRVRDLNGLEFQVIQFAPINAGSTLEVRLEGLPAHTTLPRSIAVIIAFGIVGWAVWMMRRPSEAGAAKLGPLSAQARRDRIVKAIELLERDFSEEKIKDKKYERRHEELMSELAAVLREIDLAK